ncbi:MAG: maleylpyruvate isomerase family mycothiol-dependent enzyme [Frankia sp.]|nr:maleylpyruvate isomerase family mycothiol-dependent enzyme [Frankia sp.]
MVETREFVEALDETFQSLIDVAESLDDDDWPRPTGCPGWTVQDALAHVVAIESDLVGDPPVEHELTEFPPYVRDEFGQFMEVGVDARRGLAPDKLLAEMHDVLGRRRAQLAALDDVALDGEMVGPMGFKGPARRMLRVRLFDVWAHEQDIRRATERPGHLTGRTPRLVLETIFFQLGRTLGEAAPAPPGTTLDVVITEPEPLRRRLRYGDDAAVTVSGDAQSGEDAEAGDATATIATDLSSFTALAGGRADAPTLDSPALQISGDRDLVARVLPALGITP